MTNYQYPQQPWTDRAQVGTQAAQSAQPTRVYQPVRESPTAGRLAQQSSFAEPTGAVGTPQPSRQETAQYVGQPTRQEQAFSPSQIEPTHQSVQHPQAQQGATLQPQQLAQPVTTSPVQPRQVAPETQRLARPAVSAQQLPARTEWAQIGAPAASAGQQQVTRSGQTLPIQQHGGVQMAGSQAPSGVQTAGGQTAARVQSTDGEQAMAAPSEFQVEQPAEAAGPTKGMPNVDIYETPDELVIFADVPGCDAEKVELLGNEGSVTLVANRGEPSVTNGKSIQRECAEEFERTVPLPARADIDEAEATVDDGVCRITLPKSEDDREKRIGIQ